jgi:hypothetical protein
VQMLEQMFRLAKSYKTRVASEEWERPREVWRENFWIWATRRDASRLSLLLPSAPALPTMSAPAQSNPAAPAPSASVRYSDHARMLLRVLGTKWPEAKSAAKPE